MNHYNVELLKYQIEALNKEEVSFYQVEETILEFVNKLGSFMESVILKGIQEPTTENRILINGKKSLYKGKSKLTFQDRFGTMQALSRRAERIYTSSCA